MVVVGKQYQFNFFLQEVKFFIKFDQCLKYSYDSFFEENNYEIFKRNMKEFFKNSNLEIQVTIKYIYKL